MQNKRIADILRKIENEGIQNKHFPLVICTLGSERSIKDEVAWCVTARISDGNHLICVLEDE